LTDNKVTRLYVLQYIRCTHWLVQGFN